MLPAVNGMPYIAFLAAGTVCSSTMMSASFESTYSGFSRMHVQRTWDAIMNAPVLLEDIVLGEAVCGASKAFLSGTAVLVVAALLGVASSPLALWVLPLVFVTGFAFASLGLVMTMLSPSYDFFMYYFTLAITPMMLTSGVFFPLQQLPAWLQLVSGIFPLTHAVALARPLMNGAVPQGAGLHVLVLVAYSAVALYAALLLARRRLLG
jgi:lipooligosaccharide transport system permease protein